MDRSATRAAILVAVLGFFALTTATFGVGAEGDVLEYRKIAEAAPGSPDSDIGSAYTGRFAVHYAVGLLDAATPLSVNGAYVMAWLAVVAALLAVLHALCSRAGPVPYALGLAVSVLNPYLLRGSATAMGTVQDVVFVLGVAVCVMGLLRVRPALVVAGLAIAILGRQTAVLVAFAAAMWMALGDEWRRARPQRARMLWAAAGVAVVAGLYGVLKAIVAPFTKRFEPSIPGDTVLARLDELPGSASDLAQHAGRTALPLLVATAVLVVLVLRVGWRRVPSTVWWLLLVAAAVVVQPLAVDPAFPGFESNEQRLASLGLLPLAAACALLAARARLDRASPWTLAAGAALVAAGSLHHDLTRVGPDGDAQFFALQILAAAGIAALAWHATSRAPERASPQQATRRAPERSAAA